VRVKKIFIKLLGFLRGFKKNVVSLWGHYMKKYILTIIGNFNDDAICREIVEIVTPVVDSPSLKFQFAKEVLIFHFGSEMELNEIHDFLAIESEGFYGSFILSEYTDKVSVFMPEENKKHLFNLEFDGNTDDIDMVLVPKSDSQIEEQFDDEFVALLLDGVRKNIKQPTLDQLLDKIKSDGVNSLTTYEMGILEKYSKNNI